MKRIISILLALALVLGFSLVATTPVAAATTYYVATTGNDGNTGGSGDPWLTIQYAIDHVSSGDTIQVAPGTYTETGGPFYTDHYGLKFDVSQGGITLSGANAGIPGYGTRGPESIIEGPAVLHGNAIFIFDGADGVVVDGFTLKAGDDIVENRADDVVIKNNIITPSASPVTTNAPGIFACECDNLTVSYNWILDIGSGGGCGMFLGYVWGPNADITNSLIEHNLIENSGGAGILFNYCSVGSANTVEYNEIKNVGHDGIRTANSHDVSILHNEIYGSARDGVRTVTNADHTINYNCIYSSVGYGVNNQDTATLDAENNWWGDDSGPSGAGSGSGDPVSTNVDFDPWRGKQTSVSTTTSTGIASFASSSGGVADLMAVPTPPSPPVTLPHGMFNFTICCLTGSTATLSITFPDPIPVGYKWWKYVGGSWYSLPIGSDDGDSFITVTLRDNVLPDDEDTVPGQITDQGGPGPGLAVGWETYPINKVRVLLPWIALLAAVVAGASLLVLRRRRAQS